MRAVQAGEWAKGRLQLHCIAISVSINLVERHAVKQRKQSRDDGRRTGGTATGVQTQGRTLVSARPPPSHSTYFPPRSAAQPEATSFDIARCCTPPNRRLALLQLDPESTRHFCPSSTPFHLPEHYRHSIALRDPASAGASRPPRPCIDAFREASRIDR